MSVFETLNKINVNGHTERKRAGGAELTYLSWAWAWQEVKKAYPDAFYTVYERPDGCIYWTDGRTAWVKTGLTIEGLEHIEYLPVMDFRNQSIPLDKVTSMDVNKAIQRSLTKAAARHGLGLYIYAGEDLPDGEEPETPPAPVRLAAATAPARYDKKQAFAETMARLKLDPNKQEDMAAFGACLRAAQAAGLASNKFLRDMTEDEHRAAMAAVVANFEAD